MHITTHEKPLLETLRHISILYAQKFLLKITITNKSSN